MPPALKARAYTPPDDSSSSPLRGRYSDSTEQMKQTENSLLNADLQSRRCVT